MLNRQFLWGILHPNLTFGLVAIIAFLMINALGNLFAVYNALVARSSPISDMNYLAAALVYGGVVLLYAVPAYGLARLNRWARLFVIVLSGLMVVSGLVSFLLGSALDGLFMVVAYGLIISYLLSVKCRQLFAVQAVDSLDG